MYNPPVDLNEVLIFARVIQAGSFTAAARSLGMPKSSVSKKVADLEARLGTRLVQRTTRRIGLTDAGRLYFERSARIVAEVEDADQAVAELQSAPRGLLRATIPLSFGILGPIVASFLAEQPDVQVEIVCTDRRVDLVQDGFDLAVRAGPLQDSSLVAKKLGTIKRILVAAPDYLRKHGAPSAPDELAKHVCIAFGGGEAPALWSLEFGNKRIDVRVSPRFVINDFEMMLDAARAGVGIAWVLDFLVAGDLRGKKLEQVLADWCSVETPVHAVYPSARHLSPKVVRFVDHLREQFVSSRARPRSRVGAAETNARKATR
jgi:DNA-binding transcriptional LysR family regulator